MSTTTFGNVATRLTYSWLNAHPRDDLRRIIECFIREMLHKVEEMTIAEMHDELKFLASETLGFMLKDIERERASASLVSKYGAEFLTKSSISAEFDSAMFDAIEVASGTIDGHRSKQRGPPYTKPQHLCARRTRDQRL